MMGEVSRLGKQGKEGNRIRRSSLRFSWWEFAGLFFAIQVITAGQVMVIFSMMDLGDMPLVVILSASGYCVLMTLVVCVFTMMGRKHFYEKPMRAIGDAASKVAQGDFSVQLPLAKRRRKQDFVDVLFEDFNTMVEELRGIETLKDDFVGNVSHEIKTPLATIQNYADALQDGSLTAAEREEYAQAISGASKRLTALVSNILKLNKLENQTIIPEPNKYDLAEQLRRCVLSHEDAWEGKGIEFSVDVDDELVVTFDESLLEIVWNNLISNAVKFTDAGGSITLAQRADSWGVHVSVVDNGCGMDEETKKHMYDRFYQGDTSRAQEGNGLGLALAAKALALSGGEIQVTSSLGGGSAFDVWLPFKH